MNPEACPLAPLVAVISFGIVSCLAGLYWRRATRRWRGRRADYRIEDAQDALRIYAEPPQTCHVEEVKAALASHRPAIQLRLVEDPKDPDFGTPRSVPAPAAPYRRRPLSYRDESECDVPEHPPSDYGKHRSLFSYDNKGHEDDCRCFLCEEDRNWP